MRFVLGSLFGLGVLAITPAAVAQPGARAGIYRTVTDYRHRRFAPTGDEVRFSAKRNQFAVSTRRGGSAFKVAVPRDSVWGYVDEQGRFYRTQGPDDFRVEQADTITVYSRTASLTVPNDGPSPANQGAAATSSVFSANRYYFSRGISGRIYPLSDKYLREAFAAGSPAFTAAVARRGFGRNLYDFDPKTNAFYVAELFRSMMGK